MAMVLKILISIFVGCGFYITLVINVLRPYVPFATKKFLLWNVILLNSIGRQAPRYYLPDGTPVYDGNFGIMGYSWLSVLSGFVIYPIIIFVLISVIGRLIANQKVVATDPPPPPMF